MTRTTLLTLGHGYAASAVTARLLSLSDCKLVGTTRDAGKRATMMAQGVRPVAWEDVAAVRAAIVAADAVLVSTPPGEGGTDPVLARHGEDLVRARPGWLGYFSTTGVYGDRGGAWVDETSATDPEGARGARRVAAEAAWRETGLSVHVFRLPGIYGPGRSALDRVRAGTAQRIVKPGLIFSRIHVADIAQAVVASLARPVAGGRTYNVADDEPAPPQDVVTHAAELLGVVPPPEIAFEDAQMSPMARSFFAASKRVRNHRIKEELGVRLAYPSYREGLRAILDGA